MKASILRDCCGAFIVEDFKGFPLGFLVCSKCKQAVEQLIIKEEKTNDKFQSNMARTTEKK
jgi:hypothetical protein